MKQTSRILSLLVLLIAVATVMTSCSMTTSSSYDNFLKAHENSKNNTNQSTTTGDDNKTPPIYNEIVIEGGDAVDVSLAASAGLRSAVSIYASYQTLSPAAGSGVIYKLEEDGSALVITNFHVVYSEAAARICNEIELYLYGMEGEDYAIPATYVGGSAYYDLAVLQVSQSTVLKQAMSKGSVTAAKLADSDQTVVGQTAIAIGNAEAMGISITTGIVSVDSEYIEMKSVTDGANTSFRVVRVDTAVNSGNSGGGLFNAQGELIGIVNAKIINSSVENIGYAIPSNVVKAVTTNIIDHCLGKDCKTVMRPILGITVINSGLSTYYDTETGRLVRVEEISVHEVNAGGLGESILKVGDVIKSVTIGEKTVTLTRQYQLIDFLLNAREGDVVTFVVLREGVEKTVSVTLTAACITAY